MKKNILIAFLLFFAQIIHAQAPISVVKSPPIAYDIVDVQPEYPGGNNEFMRYIGKNYITPEVEGLSGILKVSFVIEVSGKIGDIKIIKDLGSGTSEEAIRVISKSKLWTPGQHEGNPVRVLFTLPITVASY
ncbi:energy transducer TonB [Flavobacterium sp.]|uniref:energy transducer TonB n=1 Tax=Flavobacterium sp. TaxID=239 RepID=UPI00286DCD7E|nr:energy transducer TonB [Flavobacterium sp.]